MFYVFYGMGKLFGEYEDAREAEEVCIGLGEDGERSWITNYRADSEPEEELEAAFEDEDCDCDCDLEMGFDPYEGCYSFDC